MIHCKRWLLAFRKVECNCIVYDNAIIIDSKSVVKVLRNLSVCRLIFLGGGEGWELFKILKHLNYLRELRYQKSLNCAMSTILLLLPENCKRRGQTDITVQNLCASCCFYGILKSVESGRSGRPQAVGNKFPIFSGLEGNAT
jgi:hypothetical protein